MPVGCAASCSTERRKVRLSQPLAAGHPVVLAGPQMLPVPLVDAFGKVAKRVVKSLAQRVKNADAGLLATDLDQGHERPIHLAARGEVLLGIPEFQPARLDFQAQGFDSAAGYGSDASAAVSAPCNQLTRVS